MIDLEQLPALLATADRRTLAAVVTHLAGDPDAVPDVRDRAALIETALRVLPPFLRGERVVVPPSDEVLDAAMLIAAGEPVDADYAPLIREQMGIGPEVVDLPLAAPAGFSVVVIGTGITGLYAGYALQRLGLADFTILEKELGPGGTWRQNTYPGARVDTPSMLYSYSFALDYVWPEHFSHQPALLDYLEHIVKTTGLGEQIRYGVEVKAMSWDEGASQWVLDVVTDGVAGQIRASFVFGATGLLRVPKLPDIEGIERFGGPWFHSANWNHEIDLTGKRVAVIGTGASANQIVPAVSKTAASVHVFQRSPAWIMSHPQYGKLIDGAEKQLIEEIPTYNAWYRFRQFWALGDKGYAMLKLDPAWPDHELAANKESDKFRAQLTEYLLSELEGREDLIAKTLPRYPVFGKRMIIDNGWFKALRRDNVHLIDSPIQRITAEGVETLAGLQPVDVIVYATGFYADRPLDPIQINGVDGEDVRARLAQSPEAYLGMAIAGCPNLLISPGPNGIPGHGGNNLFYAESHVRYMTECLRTMFDNGYRRMEVTPDAVQGFIDEVVAELDTLIWSLPHVNNWWKGDRDRVTAIIPKKIVEFWKDCRAPQLDAYRWN